MGGQAFSKLRGALITRPIQRFNIEARTDRLLKQEKQKIAPRYESDQELLEEIRQERPEIAEAATKKDAKLLGRLKDVYVASTDPQDFDPDINRKLPENPDRPLPGRGVRSTPTAGFSEASLLKGSVNSGKLNIDTIQRILSDYSLNKPTPDELDNVANDHGVQSSHILDLISTYGIFIKKPNQKKSELDSEVYDAYTAQDSWQSIDESDIAKKQTKISSSTTTAKSLPGSK